MTERDNKKIMIIGTQRSKWVFAWTLCFPLLFGVVQNCRADARSSSFNPCNSPNAPYAGEDPEFSNELTPGIPWAAWGDLLNLHWSASEIQQNELFAEDAVRQALLLIAPSGSAEPLDPLWNESTHYQPETPATKEQTAGYEAAAQLYSDRSWAEAITGFDHVAKDKDSPYRAAAAYSAARATINSGDFVAGIHRIHALVRDPDFSEFHLAAYHLIGTRADQTMSTPLIAAQYAEIEHQLLIPAPLVCRDSTARDVSRTAKEDLAQLLQTAFPPPPPPSIANYARRRTLDTLAANDTFLDLVHGIAAPSPYLSDRGWLAIQPSTARTDIELSTQDATAITAHARLKWAETGNLLWGYALAQRTGDPADLPALKGMLGALNDLPMTPATMYASETLRRHFIWHAARLMLLDGHTDDAIAFVNQHWSSSQSRGVVNFYNAWGRYSTFTSRPGGEANALLNGGVRLLLERFDLPGARRWADSILPGVSVDERLRPLLADGIDELLTGHVPGDRPDLLPPSFSRVGNFPRIVADLLPRSKITELSSHTGLSKSEQRAFIASAWLRIYMLDGWKASLKLLPNLRDAYPELATDIDNVNRAWLPRSKRHLLTRMISRLPGFDLRPSWVRAGVPNEPAYMHPDEFQSFGGSGENIFAIDGGNPSDGNWWCPIDIDQVKFNLAEMFFADAVGSNDRTYTDPLLPHRDYWRIDGAYRQAMIQLADKLIAWHPLLKYADLAELSKLSGIDSGPRFLSENAVGWAHGSNWLTRKLGFDDDLPETLYLAVRSTRYGCRRQGSHAEYSRGAYQALHVLFPQSEWAARAPYWFDQIER